MSTNENDSEEVEEQESPYEGDQGPPASEDVESTSEPEGTTETSEEEAPTGGDQTGTQDDTPSVTEDFDAYADDLGDESLEALSEVEELVVATIDGAKETEDLHKGVRDVLNQLQEGDKFGAARAVIDMFNQENRDETDEAVDAAKEVMGELEDTRAEGADVVELLVDAANEIEDEVRQADVKERISNLVQ